MDELGSVLLAAMRADMDRVGAIAHNVANVSTAGFKRVFSMAGGPGEPLLQPDRRQGALSRTGSPLDVAMEGRGFLAVEGQPLLSRGGMLRRDDQGRLVFAGSGLPVAGEEGALLLQAGAFRIDASGALFQGERRVGRLRQVQPAPDTRLEAVGNGLYRFHGGVDEVGHEGQGRFRQGFLEMSNVNASTEMVALVATTRHFESLQKVLHGLDALHDRTLRTLGEF
ncbi:flagellar basal-body rod protein FlgF/flagellar basal-body rod protein FlgG [Microvirgula sp. AG722]|uniref:flagellar hook-basal body protein n=1 Tax=Microvirgula sp. AG722 TaxID=2183901 RepID=UPI000DC2846A|nr:flagellar hook basal-body protein [Microvirgula sp. AG722]RAS15083.1 flagellar basal-body rod protein FlgF/flagellar basal-body rod protein FlgG [Microvirgula sp. AG722]